MRNFKNLEIWQFGMQLVTDIYKIAALLPTDEKYGLKSQICRAAVSIPSNIAEGCSRNSDMDYRRFLEIALGSTFELETQALIMVNLNFVSTQQISETLSLLQREQKMIYSLIAKLTPPKK